MRCQCRALLVGSTRTSRNIPTLLAVPIPIPIPMPIGGGLCRPNGMSAGDTVGRCARPDPAGRGFGRKRPGERAARREARAVHRPVDGCGRRSAGGGGLRLAGMAALDAGTIWSSGRGGWMGCDRGRQRRFAQRLAGGCDGAPGPSRLIRRLHFPCPAAPCAPLCIDLPRAP